MSKKLVVALLFMLGACNSADQSGENASEVTTAKAEMVKRNCLFLTYGQVQ